MRRLRVALGVLLSAFAAKAEANTIDLFGALHFRSSISAVHLDGNTSLFTPTIWNPPNTSTHYMVSWWEKGSVNAGTGWVIWSANKGGNLIAEVEEFTQQGEADDRVLTTFVVSNNGQFTEYVCGTPSGVVQRTPAGIWALVMVTVDVNVGQADYAVVQGESFEGGAMLCGINGMHVPGSFPWGQATGWWDWSDVASARSPVFDGAEGPWVDLAHNWNHGAFVDGSTAAVFASQQGYALGLDYAGPLPPYTHNCAEPLAGAIPNMCNRGNANAYPVGPEVSPGIDGYTMTVIGTLTTATDDPCLIRSGAGDGCAGP